MSSKSHHSCFLSFFHRLFFIGRRKPKRNEATTNLHSSTEQVDNFPLTLMVRTAVIENRSKFMLIEHQRRAILWQPTTMKMQSRLMKINRLYLQFSCTSTFLIQERAENKRVSFVWLKKKEKEKKKTTK